MQLNKKSKKFSGALQEFFIYTGFLAAITIAALNISRYFSPRKVLGTSSEIETRKDVLYQNFWREFLAKHPDYVPGLIETGNIYEARKIDPNYVINTGD